MVDQATIEHVQRFLRSIIPVGEIEYNNLYEAISFEEAMSIEKDIYFLGGVSDPRKRN